MDEGIKPNGDEVFKAGSPEEIAEKCAAGKMIATDLIGCGREDAEAATRPTFLRLMYHGDILVDSRAR